MIFILSLLVGVSVLLIVLMSVPVAMLGVGQLVIAINMILFAVKMIFLEIKQIKFESFYKIISVFDHFVCFIVSLHLYFMSDLSLSISLFVCVSHYLSLSLSV